MPRIALYGRPGAGKSTLAKLLDEEFQRAGVPVCRVRLGAPLYELQSLVYAVAGRPLVDESVQDGPLLNALGAALRRINSQALTAPFTASVEQAEQQYPQVALICDDMRAPDLEAVTRLGFRLVEVTAPEQLRLQRKEARPDLAAGDDHHSTEAAIVATSWQRVENSGTLGDLRRTAQDLLREVLR
ncbi:hypothetical protein [Streptomyces sp. NPDC048508]|uniref:hypothetical protein n=1 Tax=Streptomyces sp. NPDC048508 TaxID=3365561 RepID=UPI003715A62D